MFISFPICYYLDLPLLHSLLSYCFLFIRPLLFSRALTLFSKFYFMCPLQTFFFIFPFFIHLSDICLHYLPILFSFVSLYINILSSFFFCMPSPFLKLVVSYFINALTDVAIGVWGASRTQYFQICKKVGQKAAMLQESWQQCFL